MVPQRAPVRRRHARVWLFVIVGWIGASRAASALECPGLACDLETFSLQAVFRVPPQIVLTWGIIAPAGGAYQLTSCGEDADHCYPPLYMPIVELPSPVRSFVQVPPFAELECFRVDAYDSAGASFGRSNIACVSTTGQPLPSPTPTPSATPSPSATPTPPAISPTFSATPTPSLPGERCVRGVIYCAGNPCDSGVKIDLIAGTDPQAAALLTTTTDGSGNYQFCGVSVGTYTLKAYGPS